MVIFIKTEKAFGKNSVSTGIWVLLQCMSVCFPYPLQYSELSNWVFFWNL